MLLDFQTSGIEWVFFNEIFICSTRSVINKFQRPGNQLQKINLQSIQFMLFAHKKNITQDRFVAHFECQMTKLRQCWVNSENSNKTSNIIKLCHRLCWNISHKKYTIHSSLKLTMSATLPAIRASTLLFLVLWCLWVRELRRCFGYDAISLFTTQINLGTKARVWILSLFEQCETLNMQMDR